MAIILDPVIKPVRVTPPAEEIGRIASYPVYPSENPGTPFIPSAESEAWWQAKAPETYDPTQLSSDELKVVMELEETIKQNKNLIFTRDKSFKGPNKYSNKTYSGVDMQVSVTLPGFGSYEFGDLNSLSVATHRESFPVRVLGMVNPSGFTSGPRTIAGSMIFSVIDAYVFYKMASDLYGKPAKSLWDNTSASEYPLADSLPPFDITITFNNEYEPQGAALRIFGVKIIDDGMTMSIDDLVSENTYSFMAEGIAPVHRAKNWKVVSQEVGEKADWAFDTGWMTGDEEVNPLSQEPTDVYDEFGNVIQLEV